MQPFGFVWKLLLVMSLLFGAGALSGYLEQPAGGRDALIDEVALSNTHVSPNTVGAEFDYTCRDHVLARYSLTNDKVLHVEDIPPESPFHISAKEVLEFGEIAMSFEAKQWAAETMAGSVAEVSRREKVALFLGAASGFLAGRWFVVARALNCRESEVMTKLQDRLFWQHIIRLDFRNYYAMASFVTTDHQSYRIMEHSTNIENAIKNCGMDQPFFTNSDEFLASLKLYQPTLDDAATHIDYQDVMRRREFRIIARDVANSARTKRCLFGNEAEVRLVVPDDTIRLLSVGPLTKMIRIACWVFFGVFTIVASSALVPLVISDLPWRKEVPPKIV